MPEVLLVIIRIEGDRIGAKRSVASQSFSATKEPEEQTPSVGQCCSICFYSSVYGPSGGACAVGMVAGWGHREHVTLANRFRFGEGILHRCRVPEALGALGNHEFDEGVSGLLDPLLKNANFTILSANIKGKTPLGNEMMKYVHPFKIVRFDSESVGIVGYTTNETSFLSQPGDDVTFEDEIEALQLQVNKLTDMGVNKIIALGHSGFTVDKNIAQKVKGVDIVIGGHTNTFLYTGTPPSTEPPAGPYPFMVHSDDGRKVPVVQAYAYGKYLGYLNVTFDEKGNVVEAVGNPILLDSSIPEDEYIKEEVEKWRENLRNYSEEIGKTSVYLNGTSQACRFQECNMGNLLCDAVNMQGGQETATGREGEKGKETVRMSSCRAAPLPFASLQPSQQLVAGHSIMDLHILQSPWSSQLYENVKHPDKKTWNHVSMCILNGGGIRSPIDEQSTNGRFDTVRLKGSTLKEAFEHSVRRYGKGSGELLQVGGIHVVYDLSRAPGNRVVSLEVLCTACRVPAYVPLQMDEIYNVTLPSYMLFGGDGYSMLKDKNLGYSKGEPDIEVVSRYLQRMKRVYPAVEGRITFSSGSLAEASLTLISVLFTTPKGLAVHYLRRVFQLLELAHLHVLPSNTAHIKRSSVYPHWYVRQEIPSRYQSPGSGAQNEGSDCKTSYTAFGCVNCETGNITFQSKCTAMQYCLEDFDYSEERRLTNGLPKGGHL
ncbi:hypothetical protein IHE44_0009564 [Lamprotornis superbus]|uniref:5'-nucleotidase n=1 Tax=Lamprotornis superbus TaxID=245042 RepID=A0A835NGX3_9PASS|nr:hypothetical protein IHE44_0009564 [Lamprotornis superbus]